jgi:predicted RNase H-like HicB family nuclease
MITAVGELAPEMLATAKYALTFGVRTRVGSRLSDRRRFMMQLTAVFIKVPEGYIAFVEELPGADTQGETLEEARDNLQEAVALILEANRELAERSLAGQLVTREPFVLVAP